MSIAKIELPPGISMGGAVNIEELPDVLVERQQYPIHGRSGRELIFAVDRYSIRFSDSDPECPFDLQAGFEDKFIEFLIYTRSGDGDPHPDFFASRFYDAAYEWLSMNAGGALQGITAWWIGGSNFDQVKSNLEQGMDFKTAVFNTWGGRKAKQHGFCIIFNEGPSSIEAVEYKLHFMR